MHDPVKYALWVGGAGLLIVFVCGAYLVWANAGSRNLALGLGAVLGACVIFIVQILFELKPTSTVADFASDYTIDYQEKTVRNTKSYISPSYGFVSMRNGFLEQSASHILAQSNPALTKDDAPRIARELSILTIISVLLNEQPDWQLDSAVYRTTLGTMTTWHQLSKPNECTEITIDGVQRKLKAAGNMFAGSISDGVSKFFCLPPNTLFDVSQKAVILEGLICNISFTLNEPFASMSTIDPNEMAKALATGTAIKASVPQLPDGSPRYLNVTITGRAAVNFSALHAQDRNLAKYQAWADRVVGSVKTRFSLQ